MKTKLFKTLAATAMSVLAIACEWSAGRRVIRD